MAAMLAEPQASFLAADAVSDYLPALDDGPRHMTTRVTSPDGAQWTIRRHWVARRPKFQWLVQGKHLKKLHFPDWADIPLEFGDEGCLPILGGILAVAILVFFVIPALIFLVELVLFVALASLLVFVNSLFRRPWIVVAEREGPEPQVMRWKAVGLLRSRRVIAEISEALAQGHRRIQILEVEPIDEASQ
jgi:hypothetical protein